MEKTSEREKKKKKTIRDIGIWTKLDSVIMVLIQSFRSKSIINAIWMFDGNELGLQVSYK